MTTRRLLLAFALILACAPAGGPDEPLSRFDSIPRRPLRGEDFQISVAVPRGDDIEGDVARRKLDLRDRAGLAAFKEALGALRRLAERQHEFEESHPERILPFRYDVESSGKRHALREMIGLIDGPLGDGTGGASRDEAMYQLLELHHALDNSFRYPIKKNYEIVPEIFPILLLKTRAHRSIAREPVPTALASDPRAGEPVPSSFWSPAGEVGAKDLYAGFGRRALPAHEGICAYVKPKTGWGAHPGFTISCGGQKLEFKLGDEIYGGPFNTRVFDALGYHTLPIDRLPALKLRYDRRVLTEYNSRRYLAMRARILFIPVAKHVVTKIEDPFARIVAAVTTDGRRLTSAELKSGLLRDATIVKGRPRPETVAANYDTGFEGKLAYLVWQPGTVAEEPDTVHAIGAWDYDQLDHAERREVRAVFVLSAWLDQYNMRWENTRLAYVREGEVWQLRHLFSDVGSGLSDAHTMLHSTNSDVEKMPWTVTEVSGGKVKFSGFAPNVMNDAFARTTAEDARWMLRRLAALSETQILEALLATGMSAAEVRLALEKLLSKRQKMTADFGLAAELPEVMRRPIDTNLEFDPARPEDLRAVTLSRADGSRVVPEIGDWVIQKGHLVRRVAPAPHRAVSQPSSATTATGAMNR
ncbi:MAG TPA: hypothetical protein VFK70_17510 [Vicinamibacteria bacterium]|nr:hypothetical protein [Vicinamibacteria bacterium]